MAVGQIRNRDSNASKAPPGVQSYERTVNIGLYLAANPNICKGNFGPFADSKYPVARVGGE